MAFLSASVPWQALVAAYAEELESSIKVAHPDLSDVVVGVRGREVLAVAAAGASDLESVAWRIACELAPSWPGFLVEAEVGLRVVGGGWRCRWRRRRWFRRRACRVRWRGWSRPRSRWCSEGAARSCQWMRSVARILARVASFRQISPLLRCPIRPSGLGQERRFPPTLAMRTSAGRPSGLVGEWSSVPGGMRCTSTSSGLWSLTWSSGS